MFFHFFLLLVTFPFIKSQVNSNQCLSESASGYNSFSKFSTPEECLRPCTKNGPPKICYYKFTLEFYTSNNQACLYCKPSTTQNLKNHPTCECILADGVERTVFTANRMLPGPQIQVCKNDYVIVDVENEAEGTEASIHWHGLFMKNYQYYDGVPFVTQCPIDSATTFRYQFKAEESGTFFWHSHVSVHRLDGQYGPVIIRDAPEDNPHAKLYDKDDPTHVILLSDWMHELATERYPGGRNRFRGQTAQNILINGRGKFRFTNGTETKVELENFNVEPGKRYRLRIINGLTSVCLVQLSIENHVLTIIGQDGTNVEPVDVNTIITGGGERVDVVIITNKPVKSYWIQVKGLGECKEKKVQQLATLQYKGASLKDASSPPTYDKSFTPGIIYNPLDASCDSSHKATVCPSNLKIADPFDPTRFLKVQPDLFLSLPFWFWDFNETNTERQLFTADPYGYTKFFVAIDRTILVSMMDDVSFKSPSAPPISQAEGHQMFCQNSKSEYCQRNKNNNSSIPCFCTLVRHIPLNSIVEVLTYDRKLLPLLIHPFHLHGTNFHVLDMGRFSDNRKIITENDLKPVLEAHRRRLERGEYVKPAAKDTVLVPQGGWVIFRFIADNPGYWLYHCHFDWHSSTGMQVIFHIGEQSDLPPVPPGFPTCGSFKPGVCVHP